MSIRGVLISFRRCARFSLLLFLVASLTGCITKKPLPYVYSAPQVARPGSPALMIGQVADHRAGKDDMDKVLELPACLDPVISKELADSGLFSKVELKPQGQGDRDYVLQCTLNELKWEVPDYKQKVATAFTVSLLTGGIGGAAYASTKTDVIGRSKVRFIVSKKEPGDVVLDREYSATATLQKTKFECDTPATYREVAAEALRKVMDQFKGDLAKVLSADSK